MIRALVQASLRSRLLVMVLAAALVVTGSVQLRKMPVDVLPEFTPPYVEIQTEALGLSAAEVEQLITVPLEADLLNGVAWLDVIRSRSVAGLSAIELVFEPGTDLMRARQLVQERLTQAHALPNVSKPPAMLQPLASSSRFLMVGLSSTELSPIEMSVLARWTVRPRLMGVPGVANVSIWGQRERQLQVQVDPRRMQDSGVTLQQVIKTAGNALWVSPLSFVEASTPGSGGFIDTPNQRLGVQHVSPIVRPADLAGVRVEDTGEGSKALRLGDVARVVEDHQPLIGDAVVDGGGGLMLVVEKFPGANTLEVTRGVEEALAALRPGMTGVQVDSSTFRPAGFLERARDNVALALGLGGLLVLLLLALVSWRTAVITLVAVPTALAAAILVLRLRGSPMNVMVLAGLVVALGLLIDDVVTSVDNVLRRLRRPALDVASPRPVAGVIVEAMHEIRRPLLFATAIGLLAAVPLLFAQGAGAALLPPLAFSYAAAVLASTLVALTVTPALAALLLRGGGRDRQPRLARELQTRHRALLSRVLRARRAAYVVPLVLAGLALAALPALGHSLLPAFQERTLVLQWDGAPGTSRTEMNRITTSASRELRSVPGVTGVEAQVGRAVLSDEVAGVNAGQIWVTLDREADYDATVAAVEDVAEGYPGLEQEVSTYSAARMREVLTGADEPISVRLYGPDEATLRDKAEEVRDALAGVPGIAAPEVDLEQEEPQIEVQVDLAAAQRHGIKPGDVRRAATTMLSGLEVGSLFEEQKVFEVVVRGIPEATHSLTSVGELLVDKPGGGQVRLGDVAQVRIAPVSTVLEREAVSPRIDVTAQVDGRDADAVAADVERRLEAIGFPLEYRAELLGDHADRQAGRQFLLSVVLTVAVGILLLLQAAFGSWRLAALAFLLLPPALAGGVLAVLVGGGTIGAGSLAGFLLVLALAVRQSVLLVSHYRHLQEHEGEAFGPELVLRGTCERLVPILTTALATGLALSTFLVLGALRGDTAGLEVVQQAGVVALGGLVTATLLNLLVVPAFYLLAGPERRAGPAPGQIDLRGHDQLATAGTETGRQR